MLQLPADDITGLLGSWASKPLFERKAKPMSVDDADQLIRSSIANRLHVMSEDGKELHKILRDSSEVLKATKGGQLSQILTNLQTYISICAIHF